VASLSSSSCFQSLFYFFFLPKFEVKTPANKKGRPLQSSKRNESITSKHMPNLLLHIFKSHMPARLALKMIEQSGQGRKRLRTATVGAMVDLLLMGRRVQMLIERRESSKLSMTHIALVAGAVPGPGSSGVGGVFFVPPSDLLVGDNAVGISLTD
jgi:hypothetical protein